MTDIKITDDEIALGLDDLELVSDDDCLLQDIRNTLYTDTGALFYDSSYGAKVLRYIQEDHTSITFNELKQIVKIALKSDSRIVANTIEITITSQDESVVIDIDFQTTDGTQLSIQEVI